MRSGVVVLLFAFFNCYYSEEVKPLGINDVEEKLTTEGFIKHWGYPSQTHNVLTEDDYVLQMHRIPHGKDDNSARKRPVILMMHGLEESSACYVINLPTQSAGFVFADAGFDVWLGNARGNAYSMRHASKNPKMREFWRFSFDEMTKYDLRSMFEKIETVTGQREIYYMGHSQGTLMMFSKLAEEPEFAGRVKRFFALAPVGGVKNIKGFLAYLSKTIYPVFDLAKRILGDGQFLPTNWFTKTVSHIICGNKRGAELCDNLIFLLDGPETTQMNRTRTSIYVSHTPSGTSTENILHWTQLVHTGELQKYDFRDPKVNLQKYGQRTPPIYDLSRVPASTNIHLFSSDNDYLADPDDVKILKNKLPKGTIKSHVNFEDYSHVDFIWGTNTAQDIYLPIIDIIKMNDNVL